MSQARIVLDHFLSKKLNIVLAAGTSFRSIVDFVEDNNSRFCCFEIICSVSFNRENVQKLKTTKYPEVRK